MRDGGSKWRILCGAKSSLPRTWAQRLAVADALGREPFHKVGLGTYFEMAVAAVDYCRRIRNQFAHCAWYGDASGSVTFTNLEDIAKVNVEVVDFQSLTLRKVDFALLEKHLAYFDYADEFLIWLRHEAEVQHKTYKNMKTNPSQRPTEPTRPPLDIA
jgi:hypothetical protein